MIAVLFNGTPAAMENLEWTTDDIQLLKALTWDALQFNLLDQETADPDPDLTHAKAMAAKYDGVTVGADRPPDYGDQVY